MLITYFCNRKTKIITATTLNLNFVPLHLLEETDKTCEITERFRRPVLIQGTRTTIGIRGIGAMPPFASTFCYFSQKSH